jgi:hypothetical protein
MIFTFKETAMDIRCMNMQQLDSHSYDIVQQMNDSCSEAGIAVLQLQLSAAHAQFDQIELAAQRKAHEWSFESDYSRWLKESHAAEVEYEQACLDCGADA